MTITKQVMAVIILALFNHCGIGAQILNGGFEADSNTPVFWDVTPGGIATEILQVFSTLENGSTIDINIFPTEGEYFVLLKTGRNQTSERYCEITQKITVDAGQYFRGDYFFSTSDWLPYDDFAVIKLVPDSNSGLTEILLAEKSVFDVNSYGAMSEWEIFGHAFTDTDAGSYTVVLRVEDLLDGRFPSYLAVDDLTIGLSGDVNNDNTVDFSDFALLALQWANNCDYFIRCGNCDINYSGNVDANDLMMFSWNWLMTVEPH